MAFGLLHMGLPKEDVVARLSAPTPSNVRFSLLPFAPLERGGEETHSHATMLSMNPPPNLIRVHEELLINLFVLPLTMLVLTHDMRLSKNSFRTRS